MTTTGADVEGLRALATDFTRGASELQQLSAQLSRALDAADDWQGPDATRAKDQWGELARTRMTGVADALAAAGTLLDREATEQEVGSAATSTTAAHPSLFEQLKNWFTVGKAIKKAWDKGKALVAFFAALAKQSFFARTRGAITALTTLAGTGNKAPTLLLKALDKLGLTTLARHAKLGGKLLGKISPVVTVWDGVHDVLDGGGYSGWRGDVTRVLGAAGAAGAVVTMVGAATGLVASAPLVLAGAGAAAAVYGLWRVGNVAYDEIPLVQRGVDNASAAVSTGWTQAWQGARSVLDVSKTYARGLLGPAPAPAH